MIKQPLASPKILCIIIEQSMWKSSFHKDWSCDK